MKSILWSLVPLVYILVSPIWAQEATGTHLVQVGEYTGDAKLANAPGGGPRNIDGPNLAGNAVDYLLVIDTADQKSFSGKMHFYSASRECRGPLPVVGEIKADGLVVIDSNKGALRGCERTIELRLTSPTSLVGVITTPRGNKHSIRLDKK